MGAGLIMGCGSDDNLAFRIARQSALVTLLSPPGIAGNTLGAKCASLVTLCPEVGDTGHGWKVCPWAYFPGCWVPGRVVICLVTLSTAWQIGDTSSAFLLQPQVPGQSSFLSRPFGVLWLSATLFQVFQLY